MDQRVKGLRGEELTKIHYLSKGYDLRAQNYWSSRAEIDLIFSLDNCLLVFVEVKYRSKENFGFAESFVSTHQEQRIKSAAENCIFEINWQKDIRFDAVSVDGQERLTIFEDAF